MYTLNVLLLCAKHVRHIQKRKGERMCVSKEEKGKRKANKQTKQ